MSQPRDAVITQDRVLEPEPFAAENRQLATLGRYMVETRHGFNNAMTSLLGNAELLLLDPDAFSPRVLGQLQTIRDMAQRLNQVMLGFSLLEAELQTAASEKLKRPPPSAAFAKVGGIENSNSSGDVEDDSPAA